MMLQRGYEFAPGYRLQEFLGRGQFGQVWRASAPGGTATAVKFIDLTGGQGQKEYAAIKRIKQIRQANLMPIIAIWLLDKHGEVIDEAPDDALQTMDVTDVSALPTFADIMTTSREPATLVVGMLLGGASLLDRMKECVKDSGDGIPPRELLSYMEDAAKGLDFLNDSRHDLGSGTVAIQHCDVKPANIVILGNSAVICDFGLARILTQNQITATSASGTPAYMAPEAISGKPSQSSDQYSLAVTYYHLRTGTLPVKDGTLFEVLEAHRRGDLSFVSVGPQEQAVLKRATRLDWKERFESNADFIDALRDALRAEGHAPSKQVTPPVVSGAEPSFETQSDPLETQLGNDVVAETLAGPLSTVDTDGDLAKDVDTDGRISNSESVDHRMLVAAAAIGILLLTAIIFFVTRGDNDDASDTRSVQESGVSASEGDDGPLTETKSAAELFSDAKGLLSKDPKAAKEAFLAALQRDASLAESTPIVLNGHSDAVERLLIVDDDKLASIGYDKTPFWWPDTSTGKVRPIVLDQNTTTSFTIYPNAITTVNRGRGLFAGCGTTGKLWSQLFADKPLAPSQLEVKDEILAVASHPILHLVAVSSGDQAISIFGYGQTGMEQKGTLSCIDVLDQLAFDPSGQWLVALSQPGDLFGYRFDTVVDSLQSQSAVTERRLNAPGVAITVFGLPDADSVVTGGEDGSVSQWRLGDEPKLIWRTGAHSTTIESMVVTESLVISGDAVGRLNIQTIGSETERHGRQLGRQSISCLDVTSDGRWLAAGTYDGHVWLFDLAGDEKQAIRLGEGDAKIESVLIDSKGNRLIAGLSDSCIFVWDLTISKLLALAYPTRDEVKLPKAIGEAI